MGYAVCGVVLGSSVCDMKPRVLSLCDYSGVMVEPWLVAGFDCTIVDRQHPPGLSKGNADRSLMKVGADVLDWAPDRPASIVFAFPPCTNLASSGARWFKDKGLAALIDSLRLVEACRVLCESSGAPWMLENPNGTLATYWRQPDFRFDPFEFAGYLPDAAEDCYTKRTCLWVGGGFIVPQRRPLEAVLGSKMHLVPPSDDRANIRSQTPHSFAQAVFEANVDMVLRRCSERVS